MTVPTMRPALLRHVLLGLATWTLVACSPPEPSASASEIDALERDSIYVERPEHRGLVSLIRAGEPRVARVVFLHGAPGNARGWADFLLDPGPGQEYIAIDRPGFGESRPDGAVTDLDAQASAIAPLLSPAPDVPVVLVGHAHGAAVALAAAAREPERVAGLVLLAGSIDPALAEPHWARSIGVHAPIHWLLPRAVANANREHLAQADQLRRLEPRLGRIDIPVRIVHGERDEYAAAANIDYLQARLDAADLSVVRLRNAGHFLPWSAPAVVRGQINNLVAGICGGLSQCERASRADRGDADSGEPG